MTLRPAATQPDIVGRPKGSRRPSVSHVNDGPTLLTSRVFWCLIAIGFIAARGIAQQFDNLAAGVGDSDDAMRLVQVRDFIAAGDWFNLQIAQIGTPDALVSHWSRLLDIPLAVLVSLFGIFLAPGSAEVLMQIVWPLLVLTGLLGLAVRDVDRQGGLWAVAILLFLVVASVAALIQFAPGRIDHHNVQNLCAVGGILLLFRSLTEPRLGWWAGALLGLGLGVGLEALPLVAFALGVAALGAGFDADLRRGVRRMFTACAITLSFCFLLTTSPQDWFDIVCDTNSLNLVLLAGACAVSVTVLTWLSPRASAIVWTSGLIGGATIGIAAYVSLEPACALGPFGMVDLAIRSIWLHDVFEVQSILDFARDDPSRALSILVMIALGTYARWALLQDQRDMPALVALVVTLAAGVYGCIYIKLVPYAVWLALVPTALWLARLPPIGHVPKYAVRIAATVFASQAVLILIAQVGLGAFASMDRRETIRALANAHMCQPQALYHDIARLPVGLVASHVTHGPFIVRNTPHRALAGPYHRIGQSILASHRIMTSRPAAAKQILQRLGVDYLMLCQGDRAEIPHLQQHSLARILLDGGTAPFLQPMTIGPADSPLRIWSVEPAPIE